MISFIINLVIGASAIAYPLILPDSQFYKLVVAGWWMNVIFMTLAAFGIHYVDLDVIRRRGWTDVLLELLAILVVCSAMYAGWWVSGAFMTVCYGVFYSKLSDLRKIKGAS